MCKWKLVWKSAMFHLRQEMRNPRFLLSFVLAFVLCLMLSDKAVFFAESYGTSMQVFETFILAFGDGKSIMLSTLLLIFLFADLPVNNQLTPYYLTRITKNIWIWGQLLYVFLITVFYVLFLLLVTCIICGNISFVGNMWSETMALLGYSGAGQKIALPASLKTLEATSPYPCAAVIFLLIAGYALVNATMLLAFRLGKHPALGSISVFLFNLFGLFLNPEIFMKLFHFPGTVEYKAQVITGWISPLNHATYYMHNFGYDYLPRIGTSLLFFCVMIGVNILIIKREMKHFEFLFVQKSE